MILDGLSDIGTITMRMRETFWQELNHIGFFLWVRGSFDFDSLMKQQPPKHTEHL
jgi:hypothetical protein